MSIHSWTILSLTKVRVIHVTGTKIYREPILGKLFGRSPNRIYGCPGGGWVDGLIKIKTNSAQVEA